MKKRRLILLVIFLPAALVLFVMGIIELVQPKFAVEPPSATATLAPAATSTPAPVIPLTTHLPAELSPTPSLPPAAGSSTPSVTLMPSPSATTTFTPSPPATSTFTPSMTPSDTSLPATATPTITPCLDCTSTPSYLSTMATVMSDIAGTWSGVASMTVDKQSRHKRSIKLTIYEGCSSGVVCGEYHDESTCSGFLTFHKMSGITYIFASHSLGNPEKCGPDGLFYIKQKTDGNLTLSIYITDQDGRRIVRSATLVR